MTGLFAFQYWTIFFLMVGLCCKRPFVSRLAFSAVTLAIGRFFVRSVTNWLWGPDNAFGSIIGSDPAILMVNFGVLVILMIELVTGHRDKQPRRVLIRNE